MNLNHFKIREFRCRCGCNDNVRNGPEKHMNPGFLLKLDKARELADVPFSLTSAYRCPIYNKTIGAEPTSSHVKGCAVDIKVTNSNKAFKILKSLLDVGFTRVGIGPGFIHVDDDEILKPPFVAWTYYEED